MQELFKAGKYLFAFSIIAFGIIQFGVQEFMKGFLPMPEGLPARIFFLNFISTLFVAGGIAMCIRKTMHRAALLIGLLLFILFIYPHLVTCFPISAIRIHGQPAQKISRFVPGHLSFRAMPKTQQWH